MINEVKKYTNDEGMSVQAYIPTLTEEASERTEMSPELIAYEGTVGIKTPMGVQPIHFPFPDDYTLEQCFEKFEEVADIEIKKIMEEAEQKQKDENLILTPGQGRGQGSGGNVIQMP